MALIVEGKVGVWDCGCDLLRGFGPQDLVPSPVHDKRGAVYVPKQTRHIVIPGCPLRRKECFRRYAVDARFSGDATKFRPADLDHAYGTDVQWPIRFDQVA